jgi:hypothetical protein
MTKKINFEVMKLHFLSGLIWVFSSSAIAQMDHSSHMGKGGSSKPANSCVSIGLECANAATPFLDTDGSLFLVWTAGGVVSVAKSQDLGKSFAQVVVVAEHGKSLDAGGDARPQVVADKSGNVFIAYAFFKDSNWNAQVNMVRSVDGGKTFGQPQSIVSDASSQRFPSLAITPGGSLFLSWIDKRLVAAAKNNGEKRLGGSIAYAFSNDFGKTFQPEKIANENSCECCRIGAAADLKGGVAIIYRAIFPGGVRDHAIQRISESNLGKIHRVSHDEWKTDACPHHGPSITISQSGKIHTAWFTQGKARQGVFYASSNNDRLNFSSPMRLGGADDNISRPYLLAIGKSVWLVWKSFDGEKNSIYLRRSDDEGVTWTSPQVVVSAGGYSDHPLLVRQNDEVFLSWLTRNDGYQLIPLGGGK